MKPAPSRTSPASASPRSCAPCSRWRTSSASLVGAFGPLDEGAGDAGARRRRGAAQWPAAGEERQQPDRHRRPVRDPRGGRDDECPGHKLTAADGRTKFPDEDRDSLHTLPIAILPVQTPIFRRARMVKNSRLEFVIEFFNGVGCGRGQLDVTGVAKFLGLEQSAAASRRRCCCRRSATCPASMSTAFAFCCAPTASPSPTVRR